MDKQTITIPTALWEQALTVMRRSPEQQFAQMLQMYEAQQQERIRQLDVINEADEEITAPNDEE